jgi:hypothetical protein
VFSGTEEGFNLTLYTVVSGTAFARNALRSSELNFRA